MLGLRLLLIYTGVSLAIFSELGNADTADAANKGDFLPLELYLPRADHAAMKKWFASREGKTARFGPEVWKGMRNHLRSYMRGIDFSKKDFAWPWRLWILDTAAMSYSFSKDEALGRDLKKVLMYLVGVKSWTPSKGPPFSEARFTREVAVCYDFVCPLLSQDDREKIAAAVENKGLEPLRKHLIGLGRWNLSSPPYDPGYVQESNQATLYLTGVFAGAKLMYHDTGEEAYRQEYLQADRALSMWFQHYFFSDGSASPVPTYLAMALREVCHFLPALARSLGMSVEEYLPDSARNPFEFVMYLHSNASLSERPERQRYLLNFGDSINSGILGSPMNAHAVAIWSAFVHDPYLLWFYKHYVDYPGAPRRMPNGAYFASHYYRSLLEKEIAPVKPRLRKERLFPDAGFFVWRDGFKKDDKLFALSKRVSRRGDHLDSDQNVFLLEAFGDRYFSDRGRKYGPMERTPRAFSRPDNNNQLTINHERAVDVASRTKMTPYLVSDRLDFARSDATDVVSLSKTASHAARFALYIKPDYFMLLDTVRTKAPATVECNFITPCTYSRNGRWLVYKGRDSKLYHFIGAPEQFNLVGRTLEDERKNPAYAIAVETPGKVTETAMMNVFYPVRDGNLQPEIKRSATDSGTLLEVRRNAETRDLIVQRVFSKPAASVGRVKTDCEVSVIFFQGEEVTGGGMFNGAYLMLDGKELVRSDKRAAVIFYRQGNNIYGEAQVSERVKVTFSLWTKPLTMTLKDTDLSGYRSFCSFR